MWAGQMFNCLFLASPSEDMGIYGPEDVFGISGAISAEKKCGPLWVAWGGARWHGFPSPAFWLALLFRQAGHWKEP